MSTLLTIHSYMSNEDCSIVYDSHAKAYRLVQKTDSEPVDTHRFAVIGHAKGTLTYDDSSHDQV